MGVHVLEVGGFPAQPLGPVAEVQVLGQRGRAPTAGFLDRAPAPDAGCAREVGEVAARATGGLLDQEVEVDGQRLQEGERRVALVEVPPAGVGETDLLIFEGGHGAAQEVGPGHEVGVHHRQQRRRRQLHPVRQRARLVAGSRTSPDVVDPQAAPAPVTHPAGDDLGGVVVGVVQDLDLQPRARPVQGAGGVDHALGHVALVVDRKLHADRRLAAVGERG